MKTRNLAVPLLALLALVPALAVPSGAAAPLPLPVLREYPSPIGADVSVGLPIPPELGAQPFVPDEQNGLADRAAEPTIGINPKTGAVLYIAKQQTLKVTDFDAAAPGSSVWEDVTEPIEGLQTSDPIVYTDPDTGRTFVNQLLVTGCSLQAFTDDDGASYTRSVLGCGGGAAFDHQTIVTGKPTADSAQPPPVGYPNYLYYCTNDVALAGCATSIDGGLTFLPEIPVYTLATSDCSGIFGHLKTSPVDGTLYLMPDGCGEVQGVWRSRDNAVTWEFSEIPGSTVGAGGHPSLAVADDGTVYASWTSTLTSGTEGPVQVAVSKDQGETWSSPVAVGTDQGVLFTSFPVAVAGDGDRAAVAYLGSKTDGDPRAEADYDGTWRLYLSTTYDGGATFRTVDATPASPIQVGSICTGGLSCGEDRNLLDFNDMDLDPATGRVLVALADGCLKTTGCTPADRLDKGLLVRQVGGTPLRRTVTPPPATPPTGGGSGPGAGAGSAPRPGAAPTGGLAATGGPLLPALAAVALLGVAVGVRRRSRD